METQEPLSMEIERDTVICDEETDVLNCLNYYVQVARRYVWSCCCFGVEDADKNTLIDEETKDDKRIDYAAENIPVENDAALALDTVCVTCDEVYSESNISDNFEPTKLDAKHESVQATGGVLLIEEVSNDDVPVGVLQTIEANMDVHDVVSGMGHGGVRPVTDASNYVLNSGVAEVLYTAVGDADVTECLVTTLGMRPLKKSRFEFYVRYIQSAMDECYICVHSVRALGAKILVLPWMLLIAVTIAPSPYLCPAPALLDLLEPD